MPADVTLRRFAGLQTFSPDVEGEADQLLKAENIIFDNDGIAMARQGLRYRDNANASEHLLIYAGRYDRSFDQRIFVSEDAYYEWDGIDMDKLGVITVSSGLRGGGTTTLNIPSGHPFEVGDSILVNVATASADGVFTVSATGATTVSYLNPGVDEGTGAGFVTLIPANQQDPGVQYAGKIYFADGKHLEFSDLHNTPGQPESSTAAMTIHAERMWFIARNTDESRLYYSAPGNPESWPAANFIDVGPNMGRYPTALRSFQNKLFIFKDRETWVLETPGIPTTWVLRKFIDIGAEANSTIDYDGVMYWTALTGAYKFDGSGVERISDPVQDVWRARDTQSLGSLLYSVYTAAYKDTWYMGLVMRHPSDAVENYHRIMCFHTKLGLWSEFTTPLINFSSNRIFASMWAEEHGTDNQIKAGLHFTFDSANSPTFGFISSTIDQESDLFQEGEIWGDQIGPAIVTLDYDVVLQTKFSDYGAATDKKRAHLWVVEYQGGGDLTVEQIDERGVSVETMFPGPYRINYAFTDGSRTADTATLTGLPVGHKVREGDYIIIDATDNNYDRGTLGTGPARVSAVGDTTVSVRTLMGVDASSGPGTITLLPSRRTSYLQKAKGFGYFRRLSLKITATEIADTGFKLLGLNARMTHKGQQVRSVEHSQS